MAQQYLNELGLAGNQSMPISSTLVFWHPSIDDRLHIRSGAHSIKWSYELNTASTPTVGGEVVQILSCFVGPITITGEAAGYQTGSKVARTERPGWGPGTTTPTDEALTIVDWFLQYMHLAGTLQGQDDRRNEAAIKFSYPARGWEFFIQVTALSGFDFSADQVTVPWSITAEIVSDAGLDYFEAATMNSFTDSLTERKLLYKAISPGFDYRSNPFLNPGVNDPGGAALSSRLGDNFQSLVASWADADFMTWGFNPFGNPGELMPEDPYTVWQRLLGGEFIGQPPTTDYLNAAYSAAGGGGASGSQTLPGQVLPEERWIQSLLEALGYPLTQQNICFMRSWQAWEGGHTKNTAKFNWLNSTQKAKGSVSAGTKQASVQAYPDFETGVQATAQTITSGNSGRGYPAIEAALASGNPTNYWDEMAADLRTWHGGQDDAYRNKIRASTEQCLAQYASAIASVGVLGPVLDGGTPVWNMRPTHWTSGVDNSRAIDVVANPGTPVYAPEDMDIEVNDPWGAQGGGRARAVGASGIKWWMGHLTGGRTGPVKKGEQFSTISSEHSVPHIHVGIDTTAVLGRPLTSPQNYSIYLPDGSVVKTVGEQLSGNL